MSIDDLKSRAKGISLGLFAADLGNLRRAAQNVAEWGCNILHFDIMDGVFVPQMIGGPGFVAAMDLGLLRDVHLMVQNPAAHVESYIKAGADMITVHAESDNATEAIKIIQASNRPVMAGLALMPGTTLEDAAPLLALNPDMILVLSLDPRGTRADITAACTRLTELRETAPNAVLAFDGGVTLDSITEIAACAPDMVVSGSAVLGAKKPKRAFAAMVKALETANT
ncbi:ribulose phosphate epimerase [Profundibacter sp.]|uniref:ribulose phosphate epimerase n=1 Tax=Profundibacter sp. TaxID=3101071 RepID=UPI003D0D1510